ncbi:MAG: phosphoribosylformylglycinamidine synthase subunit PurQ [Candidatus Levybacteria bacterium]|nr:phosphoribosylformylglycinamidine synthase subunit PurQ [Candidatus Levybacteria bacterium]
MKPKVLVFAGYGLNCEEETQFAFNLSGANATIIHINDVIKNKKQMRDFQIIAFPGGFSYGDDTGSGNAYAHKIKNHLWDEIERFVADKKLIIGICNGCQILVNLGLVPAINNAYGVRQVALLHNDSARYIDRWVDLKVESISPWLQDIDTLSVPIAHGEGRLFADGKIVKELHKKKLIAFTYTKGEMSTFQNLQANPTGTAKNIAGLTDESGRVLGMMPHPERALFFTQLPNWTFLKEEYMRQNKKIPVYGPGLKIFQNAAAYFT